MSYIGSTPTTQNFIAGTDSFNGNGSATNFTLSRFVNSTNDIQVVVNNVVQYPPNYSVSGNTLTISPAPSAGTNNVYVRYLSTTLQSIAPSQGVAIQFGTGSVGLPSISFIGDSNTGIYSPAADTIAFVEGGTEAVRIDSNANVGIGTTSPLGGYRLSLTGGGGLNIQNTGASDNSIVKYSNSGRNWYAGLRGDTSNVWALSDDSAFRMIVDTSGNFQFNSGYGSVATAYGCRAWVNFNGTGTVAIRASGNVSSITDNGVGDYTVNFTNALSDANYCPTGIAAATAQLAQVWDGNQTKTTTAYRFTTLYPNTLGGGGAAVDTNNVQIAIFR